MILHKKAVNTGEKKFDEARKSFSKTNRNIWARSRQNKISFFIICWRSRKLCKLLMGKFPFFQAFKRNRKTSKWFIVTGTKNCHREKSFSFWSKNKEWNFWEKKSFPTMTLTWFPKTPMEQADDTWFGPNQTAANLAGRERMNTWLTATIDWPIKAT